MTPRVISVVFSGMILVAASAILGPGLQAQIDPPPTCVFGEGGNCFHDTNPCTTDRCNQTSGQCEHVPMVCEGDANLCTIESCNPTTGRCESGTPTSCGGEGGGGGEGLTEGGEGDLCSGDSTCNPSSGQCEPGQPVRCEQDANLCTTEACDPATGQCRSGPPNTCNGEGGGEGFTDGGEGDLCSGDSTCNPSSGQCEPGQPVRCEQDANLCTTEACDPATGQCRSGPPNTCNGEGGGGGEGLTEGGEGDLCAGPDTCNPSSGQCEPGQPVQCEQDDNLCTLEACNPATGQCHSGPPKTCNGEGGGGGEGFTDGGEEGGDACVTAVCSPATGQCEDGPPRECAQDDDLCTIESCDPETGDCASEAPKPCEADDDLCTMEQCDPSDGVCKSETENPPAEGCQGAICRTPGFWGTHAGTEKRDSINVTQQVINQAAGMALNVCGETIRTTILNDDASAVEAICVKIMGVQRLQLARQLTAAALNCVVSDGDASCSSTPLYASLFASCNAICASSGSSGSSVTGCIDRIDCLNNGGRVLASGACQTGTCSSAGHEACGPRAPCLEGSSCVPLDGNCHSQRLVNADIGLNLSSTGPAGSSKACNSATGNTCDVIGSGQANCPN